MMIKNFIFKLKNNQALSKTKISKPSEVKQKKSFNILDPLRIFIKIWWHSTFKSIFVDYLLLTFHNLTLVKRL